MTIEERVKQLEASISDPDVRASTVVAFVRAALQAEALAELQLRQEALAAHRRQIAADRQRRHRGEVSRSECVTERDEALQSVTARDTQIPAESPQKSLAPAPSGGFGGSLSGSLPVSSSGPDSSGPSKPDLFSHNVMEVLAHYRTHHPQALKKPTADSKEWRLVRARLKEGSTVEDLKKAIDGYHLSPHHLGQNERGQRYLDLTLIMRDASHVARGIEYVERGPPRPMSDREVTNRAAIEGYRALMEARR